MIRRNALLAGMAAGLALAQPSSDAEKLRARRSWDTGFMSRRPPGKQSEALRIESNDDAFLGITLWRLRVAKPSDDPAVKVRLGNYDWTLERVSQRAPLGGGERIRISVESERAGYLYVIVRMALLSGGKQPVFLIYPPPGSGPHDNYVTPGTMVAVPSPNADPAYLQIRGYGTEDKYTVLLTPRPIPGIGAETKGNEIVEQLADWRTIWGRPVKQLDAPELAPKVTPAEAGVMRQPSLRLTQDDPPPQDLYHASAAPNEPIIVDLDRSFVIAQPKGTGNFGIGGLHGIGARKPPTAPAERRAPPSRVTASSFLTPDGVEPAGYGLYSYVLFGSRPESLDSSRWQRYFQIILAFLTLPSVDETAKYVAPEGLNLTFFPTVCAGRELPATSMQPIVFQFDPKRVEAHALEHRAGGKPFAGHGTSNPDTACTLVSNYDYSRAQKLLALLPGSHLEGPYIVSVAQPLGAAASLPAQYLYQDLSTVPPELVNLWFKEFMAQAQDEQFWKTRSKEQFVLRLRTAIGIVSQQIPDFGSTVTWAFLTPSRK